MHQPSRFFSFSEIAQKRMRESLETLNRKTIYHMKRYKKLTPSSKHGVLLSREKQEDLFIIRLDDNTHLDYKTIDDMLKDGWEVD